MSSSLIKLVYVESIRDPNKLLHHASSLIRKGIPVPNKSRTVFISSFIHAGALASSDSAVEAVPETAGIVRCSGREELTTVASVSSQAS